nr:MAG TPA: hypothetical protein [Caudoviricetes sp.]
MKKRRNHMKGKNTLEDKPFRYGGILKQYSKD